MKILSIDVGIKNLAICILETTNNNNDFIINYWDVIDLFQEENKKCDFHIIDKSKSKNKNKINNEDKLCTNYAKYYKNNHYYCKKHANKSEYKLPTLELKKYKQLKINDLIKLTEDYDISFSGLSNKTRLIKNIESFIETNVFEGINNMKCNEISLINIGIAIKEKLDKLDKLNTFIDINIILIENQIGPIANRMNCIQGMITQYFIMKNINNILFVSAANKLKQFINKKKTTYSERKKLGIEETKKLILKIDDNKNTIVNMFNMHKKKDDLADCFLQAIWYKNTL